MFREPNRSALRRAVRERAVASLTNGVNQRFAPASWQRAPGRRHRQEPFREGRDQTKDSSSVAIRQFVPRVKPSSFNGILFIGRGPA